MGLRYAELASDFHLLFPLHVAAADFLAGLAAPPARVLDAGMDTGDYVAALSRRGFEAFGVEVDGRMHSAAVERQGWLASHFIHGDLLEIFDLVRGPLGLAYCIGGALVELGSDDEAASALAQLADLARPGGKLVVELSSFDHLEHQAQRALAAVADDLGSVRYADLLDASHGHDSPQTARVEGDALQLLLPPISAFREDGAELRLERSWAWPPEDGRVKQQWQFSAPEGDRAGEFSALYLTRARLEPLLPAAAYWLGGYDGREWTPDAPLTIAVLDLA